MLPHVSLGSNSSSKLIQLVLQCVESDFQSPAVIYCQQTLDPMTSVHDKQLKPSKKQKECTEKCLNTAGPSVKAAWVNA